MLLAANAIGIPTNADPVRNHYIKYSLLSSNLSLQYLGDTTGVYNTYTSVNKVTGERSYGATTYYTLACSRSNFKILTSAQATKIDLTAIKSSGINNFAATSVEFSVGGKIYKANAKKEIIISGGVFNTPQLLELSGIGDSTLLKSKGITPIIDLKGVGENLVVRKLLMKLDSFIQIYIVPGSPFRTKRVWCQSRY